jgi:hypothetical protein
MKRAKLFGINILIFIIGFLVIDFILGLILIPYDYNSFREKHPYYHHGLKRNQSCLAAWGRLVYPVYTNSLGLRDSGVHKISKTSDNKRILIIGDSHAEGVGVKFENSFPGILKEKAARQNIEILNASVVSYSPLIYYLKADWLLNTEGLDVDEIWVFVDISDMQNEIAYENFHPEEVSFLYPLKSAFISFLEKRSFTSHTIHSMAEAKKISAFVNKMKQFDPRSLAGLHKNTLELYYDFFRDFDNDVLLRSPAFHDVSYWYYDSVLIHLADKGLELGMKNMTKLSDLCDSLNIKLRLSVHPWRNQVMKQDTMDYYVTSWRNFCAEQNIDFINLFPVFINGENPFTVTRKYFILLDNHWNEEGHRIVAEYLSKIIK